MAQNDDAFQREVVEPEILQLTDEERQKKNDGIGRTTRARSK